MRVFVFVLLVALIAGCGSDPSSPSAVSGAAAPPPELQSLSGKWEGPGLALRLDENAGLVVGHGRLRRGEAVVPVEIVGRLQPAGQASLTLLPHDGSRPLAAEGRLSQGSLHLQVEADKSVELRSAAPFQGQMEFFVSASAYSMTIALNANGQNTWTCQPALFNGQTSGSADVLPGPDGTLVIELDSVTLQAGRLTFPVRGGPLQDRSYVLDRDGNRVILPGSAQLVPGTSRPPSPQLGATAALPNVPAQWTGPDFNINVNQSGPYLSASGLYQGLLMVGVGSVGPSSAVITIHPSFGGRSSITIVWSASTGAFTVSDN